MAENIQVLPKPTDDSDTVSMLGAPCVMPAFYDQNDNSTRKSKKDKKKKEEKKRLEISSPYNFVRLEGMAMNPETGKIYITALETSFIILFGK